MMILSRTRPALCRCAGQKYLALARHVPVSRMSRTFAKCARVRAPGMECFPYWGMCGTCGTPGHAAPALGVCVPHTCKVRD